MNQLSRRELMDYGMAAAKYIDAFMQNVKPEEVERRFVSAQKFQG